MLGRHDSGQRTRQYGDGGNLGCQSSAVGGCVDAESQAADDREPRNALGELLDDFVAHGLAVRRCVARADDRERACCEYLRVARHVDDVGIVRDFAQQGRVIGVGGSDGRDVVLAAVFQLFFCGGESCAPNDLPGRFGTQLRMADEFLLGGFENPCGRSEAFQQMDRTFHSDSRSHLQSDVFDAHACASLRVIHTKV